MDTIHPSVAGVLAEAVEHSRRGFRRYLAGFDDSNHTRTAPNLPNHAAWVLGHCAMTMHRAAQRLDGRPLPDSEFIEQAHSGDATRFGTESVCTGSTPSSNPGVFPPWERGLAILEAAYDRLIAALHSATPEQLSAEAGFFGGDRLPLWAIAPRIIAHNAHHAGQLACLRRALGMAPIHS